MNIQKAKELVALIKDGVPNTLMPIEEIFKLMAELLQDEIESRSLCAHEDYVEGWDICLKCGMKQRFINGTKAIIEPA